VTSGSEVLFRPAGRLRGRVTAPADKSITQRALILAALCEQPVRISNPLWAGDTEATASMLMAMGVRIVRSRGGGRSTQVSGRGLRGLLSPHGVLDARNSATAMRLLAAVCAGQRGRFEFDGDESLRRRPMDRVVEPLQRMGVDISARDGRFAPLVVSGGAVQATSYRLPVASAQVKSAVLLAGLFAKGETTVQEPLPSRDHTERMLVAAGVPLRRARDTVTVSGVERLELDEVVVPGDVSSAAFLVAAAAIVPGSDLHVQGVGLNPTRLGFLEVVRRMGGSVSWTVTDETGNEPRGDVHVRATPLTGVHVATAEVPSLIDEVGLVALLGCYAEGDTVIDGVAELRFKETDRLSAVGEIVMGLGGAVEVGEASLTIHPRPLLGGSMSSRGDHRLAMLGAVAGLASREGVAVRGFAASQVTYPGFVSALQEVIE
jgi:3-phosphoshikimate 1-carboxyvinyltransferase